jgi:hypothetical protein
MEDSTNNIDHYLSLYSCYILIPIGVIGNVLSIIILSRKDFRKQSISTYLITISVLNILDLSQIPNQVQIVDYYSDINLSCKLTFGMILMLNMTQSWLAVVAIIDRFLEVVKPFKFGFKRIKKFQIYLLAFILVLIIIGCFPLYFRRTGIKNENKIMCKYDIENEYIWASYYALIDITLFVVVFPYSIIIISSVFIIKKILKLKVEDDFTDKDRLKEIDSAKTVIVLDLFLIITSLANFIYDIYFNSPDYFISDILYIISNSSKIFTFFILFFSSKLFKVIVIQSLKCIFCCCIKAKKNLKINERASQAPNQGTMSVEIFSIVPV